MVDFYLDIVGHKIAFYNQVTLPVYKEVWAKAATKNIRLYYYKIKVIPKDRTNRPPSQWVSWKGGEESIKDFIVWFLFL